MVAKNTTASSASEKTASELGQSPGSRLDDVLTPTHRTMGGGAPTGFESGSPEEDLGRRVKEKRVGLGLTHDGLSELTKIVDADGRGISRTTIRGYELGTYKPGAREIRILSLALKVTPTWLLLGGDDALDSKSSNGEIDRNAGKPRWIEFAWPLLAYSQLAPDEKQQIRALIDTMYRLHLGAVKYASAKSFIEDFVDTVQDAFRDAMERGGTAPDSMRSVLLATVLDFRQRHGAEEANLLDALIEPLIGTLGVLREPKKQ